MEQRDEGQLELFSARGEFGQSPQAHRDGSFLARIRAYEKTILVIICLFVTALVAYTIGIEKGKARAAVSPQARVETVPQRTGVPAVGQPQPLQELTRPLETKQGMPFVSPTPVPEMKAVSENSLEKKAMPAGQRYTIQLASYKSRAAAEKEAAKLHKKGYLTVIASKGSYSVVCVGNFSSKEKAQPVLAELKQRYAGSYIRKL